MARARKKPIPITVVVGPQGSGKTTLINRLLRDPAFAATAVMLNDFGNAQLEGAQLAAIGDNYLSFGSGCVCCSVRGALTEGLEGLVRDLDNGRVSPISRVIVEADADADPAAVLASVIRHPYLSLRFVADGIVAVVPSEHALAGLARMAGASWQVAIADVVAVYGAPLPELAAFNPLAKILDAAAAPPNAFTGYAPFDPAIGDIDAWLARDLPSSHALTGEAGRIHSFAIARERTIPLAGLDRLLDYLVFLQGPNLIRVRAAVATDDGEIAVVESMGRVFYPPTVVLPEDGAKAATRFVVVARDCDEQTFAGYIDAFLNEARVDTPDRAALTDNPLAIAGFVAREGR